MIALLQLALFVAFCVVSVFGLFKLKSYLIKRGHAAKIEKFNKFVEPRHIREARKMQNTASK